MRECNAEFPTRHEDRLTTAYLVNEELLDEWPFGPIYQCCKAEAEIVVDYPPLFPADLCAFCMGEIVEEYLVGIGLVRRAEPCGMHSNALGPQLSFILGVSVLGMISG